MTKPPSADDEIDRLYQLPLGEFTAARNALAKRLGPDGAPVRSLQKPNLAAWLVNQLYWRRRPAYDRLVAAAQARRAAHARLLKGKGGDVAASEKAHATAVRGAADEIRRLLAGTEGTASTLVMNAVTDTLQALPVEGRPGRLMRPLSLVGFEALAGLVPSGDRAVRHLTVVAPAPARKPRDAGEEARAAMREAAAQRREQAETRRALALARAEARKAEAALAAAKRALARARTERDRLQNQLEFAMKQVSDATADLREREQRASRTAQEQARLEAKLTTTGQSDR